MHPPCGRCRHTAAERAILTELGGHNRTGLIEPNFRGRLCHAGSRYFIIKSNGQAFRCYPASRGAGPGASLGSFLDGIMLAPGPALCPFNHCNCTVPIHRGMIKGIAPSSDGMQNLEE